MDYFFQYYHKIFDPCFKEYGFKRYKNLYYRVVNDVIQSLSVQKMSDREGGGECTINVVLAPICVPINLQQLSHEGMRLHVLLFGYDKWWKYNNNADIEKALDNIYKISNTKLMELFNCVTSTRDFYDYFTKHGSSYADSVIFACLKNGLYKEALDLICKSWQETEKNIAYNIKKMKMSSEDVERYKENAAKNFRELNAIKNAIVINDINYIHNLIEMNEKFTLDQLTEKGMKKKA